MLPLLVCIKLWVAPADGSMGEDQVELTVGSRQQCIWKVRGPAPNQDPFCPHILSTLLNFHVLHKIYCS